MAVRLTLDIVRPGCSTEHRSFSLHISDVVTIGSGPSCDCIIEDHGVQPVHLQLTATDGGIEFLDCSGGGDIEVNGRRAWHGMLNAHDAIRLGGVKLFVSEYATLRSEEIEQDDVMPVLEVDENDEDLTLLEMCYLNGNELLRVEHLKSPHGLWIGDRGDDDIGLACGGLPVCPFPLVRFVDGRPFACVAVGMTGEVVVQGATYSLEEAVASGFASIENDFEDAWRIEINPTTRVRIAWSGATFTLRMVSDAYIDKSARSVAWDRAAIAAVGLSLVVHGVVFLMMLGASLPVPVPWFPEQEGRFAQLLLSTGSFSSTNHALPMMLHRIVYGALSYKEIQHVLEFNRHDLDACVAREKKSGRIVLQWMISALGDVTKVEIRSDWPVDSAARECVLAVVGAWKFPQKPGMVVAEFTMEIGGSK